MLKEYSISDLLCSPSELIPYYVSLIEEGEESRLDWPHKHTFYYMIWFMKGDGLNIIDFNEYHIVPRRMFLITPEQVHNWSYQKDCEGYVLMLDKTLAAQLGIDFPCPYVDVGKDNIFLLELIVKNLVRKCSLTNVEPDKNVEIGLLYLYSLISEEISDKVFDPGGMNILFRQFKELILSGDFKVQSVSLYADALHISIPVLNTICQDLAGSSAKQFLLDLKMIEAKRLLLYSRLNVSDIAFELGFEDPSYFARIFNKKTAMSPSSFLKKYRK